MGELKSLWAWLTGTSPAIYDNRLGTFSVYPAEDGFRWRLTSTNNRIVADSGEAYTRKADAIRAARLVHKIAGGSRIRTVARVDDASRN